jgi:hypothetical protein
MRTLGQLRIIAACVCLLALGLLGRANGVQLGHMRADKILFLGNSITFCPQPSSPDWWGLSASTPDKDYAHLLTQKLNAATGGSLAIVPPNPSQGASEHSDGGETRWHAGDPLPNYSGNIINMCDIFEMNYSTWDNRRIQNQIDLQPDIVVVQVGENMTGGSGEQFTQALGDMLTALRNSSNPHVFVTSFILGANANVDNIKRQLCAADPGHRVFVDLTTVQQDTSNIGAYGHPNDKGMALIADRVFDAMAAHAAPEPSGVALLCSALAVAMGYRWKKWR